MLQGLQTPISAAKTFHRGATGLVQCCGFFHCSCQAVSAETREGAGVSSHVRALSCRPEGQSDLGKQHSGFIVFISAAVAEVKPRVSADSSFSWMLPAH